MRLKIRHATRKSQDDREESFNPINLDYIFEEDDLLTPWLQEREHAVLDDEDNSGWLIVDDDDDEGDHATSSQVPQHHQRARSTGSGSSEGRGLSPPSGSGDDSDGSRPPTGGGSGGQWESAGSAHGCRRSIHHIDHDWNRDSTQQRRHSISTPDVKASIGRSRHIDDIYGHRDLRNQFGHLGVRQEDGRGTQHWRPICQVPYPYYPPPSQPPPHIYQPPYMENWNYSQQPHQYPYIEGFNYGTGGLAMTQQQSSSSGSNNTTYDQCTFNNYYQEYQYGEIGQPIHSDDQSDVRYGDSSVPPCNSFYY